MLLVSRRLTPCGDVRQDGSFIQASMSADVPECPSLEPAGLAVRAALGPSGYIWREVGDNELEVRGLLVHGLGVLIRPVG